MAKSKKAKARTFVHLDGNDYVIMAKEEYLTLVGADGSKDARSVVRATLGRRLREAREQAGLSQALLAERLGVTQPMVSQAESGSTRVGERYVASVLEACGLPEDWPTSSKATPRKVAPRAGRKHSASAKKTAKK